MPQASPPILQIHADDTVGVCLRPLRANERLSFENREILIPSDIPAGHKVALVAHDADAPVMKFGCSIGLTNQSVAPGEHVHTHNMRCDHRIDLEAISTDVPQNWRSDFVDSLRSATGELPKTIDLDSFTFEGYERPDGKVGTRNYLAVISNVNCSASVARMIAKQFGPQELESFPNVDGVISFRHEGGCAMAWNGYRHRMLTEVLGGLARNPNIGGFVLVGLGCEQGTLDHLISSQELHQIGAAPVTVSDNEIPVLSIQDSGGTRKTVEQGVEIVRDLLPTVNRARRTTVPAGKLILGTECGGSDGYSGITANPALGFAADLLVACGGTAILSETSEIYGAEHLLTRRSRTREVGQKLLDRMEWWRWYCNNYDEEFDNNPSVGNKAGGLTTITEKSLGAVSKGGTSPLEAVYQYAEPIDRKGFVVMDSPGFDPASVTGMCASGATLVAFTTGRGSCFGFKPTPSFKIASNTRLYQRLPEDMDFNAGTVVEGKSLAEVGFALFQDLLATASGRPTCSEQLGIGDEEFVPWLVGPVL